jgi:DNA polymerase-1
MIDMHTRNMNLINSIREKPVTRTQAKTINLSLTYGAGVKKISEALEMSSTQAKELIEAYHQAVPWLKELMNMAMQRADTQGYVKSLLGRRRRFDMYEPPYFQRGNFPVKGKEAAIAKYGNVRKSGLHKALNSVIQSTAAEQTKSAMIVLHEEGFKILLSVHDEIAISLADISKGKQIKEIMETVLPCEIPHIVDQHIGANWSVK